PTLVAPNDGSSGARFAGLMILVALIMAGIGGIDRVASGDTSAFSGFWFTFWAVVMLGGPGGMFVAALLPRLIKSCWLMIIAVLFGCAAATFAYAGLLARISEDLDARWSFVVTFVIIECVLLGGMSMIQRADEKATESR
ncbi:MAG: hypothetical protein M3443_12280, partial [Actinomycetota bacterium]|nr:hypothetical protein [Actinomycetota bacterium]